MARASSMPARIRAPQHGTGLTIGVAHDSILSPGLLAATDCTPIQWARLRARACVLLCALARSVTRVRGSCDG